MKRGFTLIELLVVIAILAALAAIIFPVFNAARRKGNSATCVSNLKQIGASMSMYAENYNDRFPYAVDPTDKYTPEIWNAYPEWQVQIPYMPMLHEVLQPYQKSKEIWKCPADNGYKVEDFNDHVLYAMPTSYKKFGSSYVWRTEIAFRGIRFSTFKEGTKVNVLFDAAGHWHLGQRPIDPEDDYYSRIRRRESYVFNVLFGDMHVRQSTYAQVEEAWMQDL